MRQFDWEGRLQESIEGEQKVWRGAQNPYERMGSGHLGVNTTEPDSEEDVPN